MTEFKARRHRLELPPMPNTDDPAVLKRAMDQMKRLVQDEFNRLSTDFYDFKKATFEAAVLPLRGVANIAITRTEYSMSATWELPDGQDITPTHVRVRILEISPNDFAEYTYPLNSWSFSGLVPGTQYTLQIQLVARFETTDSFVSTTRNCPSVPVLRTAESDIKAKVFTTPTGVGPPTDNGTNDDQVIFTFPDTDGTPGTAGGADCYWGYKFQYRTACAWADTAVSEVEVDGDVGNVTIDTGNAPFSTYPNTLFRLAYREICNGVPQDWVYGEPFMAVDYSDADCLGIAKSASLTETPYSTATVFALPSVCQDDGTWLQVVNALDDTEFTQGTGLSCIEYIDNEWTLIGKDTALAGAGPRWQPMISGPVAAIAAFNDQQDFSLSFDVKFPNAFDTSGAPATSYPIIEVGDKIRVYFIGRAADYDLMVSIPRDGGGAYTFRAEGLAYAVYQSIFYTQDVSEADGRALWVNGIEVKRSAGAIDNDFNGITDDVRINTLDEMNIRKIYFWDSVVTAVFPDPSTVPDMTMLHWYDLSDTSATILADQVLTGKQTYTFNTTPVATQAGEDGVNYKLIDGTTITGAERNSASDWSLTASASNIVTMFFIAKSPATYPGGARTLASKSFNSANQEWRIIYNGSTDELTVLIHNTSNNVHRSETYLLGGGTNQWIAGWAVMDATITSSCQAFDYDGNELTPSATGGVGGTVSSGGWKQIFGNFASDQRSASGSFPLAHLIFYDGVPSAADMAVVKNYFNGQGWTSL
jgi:hypothetical protein